MQARLYFIHERLCLRILLRAVHDVHIMQANIIESRFILGMRIVRRKRGEGKEFVKSK